MQNLINKILKQGKYIITDPIPGFDKESLAEFLLNYEITLVFYEPGFIVFYSNEALKDVQSIYGTEERGTRVSCSD